MAELNEKETQALKRLIGHAQRDTGQSRRVADFLLAWWNPGQCGGFDFTMMWGCDEEIVEDMIFVFAYVGRNNRYPDTLSFGSDLEVIVRAWRPELLAQSPMRYGEVMKPFYFSSLQLADEMRLNRDVERYARLSYQTSAAEIVSDPETWTVAETEAYAKGDLRSFSILRGYRDNEGRAFEDFLKLNEVLFGKYGQDDVAWIDYAIQEQTGVPSINPRDILSKNADLHDNQAVVQ